MATERKKVLDRLNKKKNRLVQNGAPNDQVKELFGINSDEKLKDYSTEKLIEIDAKLKPYGDLKVQTFHDRRFNTPYKKILPKAYVQRHKSFFDSVGGDGETPMIETLDKAMKSPLMKDYKNLKDVKDKRKELNKHLQAEYVDSLRAIGNDEIDKMAKKVERMSSKNFFKMIELGRGELDFAKVRYPDLQDDYDPDDHESLIEKQLSNAINQL